MMAWRMRRATMHPNAACVEGTTGLSLWQVGVLPQEFFSNILSSEKGILGQF